MITPSLYQGLTQQTAIYQKSVRRFVCIESSIVIEDYLAVAYCVQKLNGEAGEIAELSGKLLRDGRGDITDSTFRDNMKKELGDVLWYVSQLCTELGMSLEDVMEANIEKLQSRKERNVLHGEGDNR